MIQEFRVRNYKNFRDEIVFSLKTNKSYEFNQQVIKNGIIKDCLVIGENACGKTNLGYAMLDIVRHLTDKGRTALKWYQNLYNLDSTVCFEYTFCFGEMHLIYRYEKTSNEKLIREKLTINEKLAILNDITGAEVNLKGASSLNLANWNEDISLVKYVYANTVLDLEDEYCRAFGQFMQFVNGMLWFSSTEGNRYMGFATEQGNLFEAIASIHDGVKRLEQFLGELGITYQLVAKDKGEGMNIYCRMGKREVPLAPLLSSGTRSVVFFFFWYMQMQNVSFVYVDEFDAFYHTDLAAAIVRKIIDIPNTQAVITSHNTDLLSNGLLRPDCIFKLADNQIKPFAECTDKALREAHNLQKMYKAGAFND
ncbi:MAG: ATP-binding protein [Muribaculum sp.]|nr:ATP-binding protein [Muribaculum sp.]